MASTQPHNAQADPRFIARDLPLCRPAHATRKEMSRAVGRPLAMAPCDEQTSPFAPAPKKAAATVRHACSLSNVEMTYLFSCQVLLSRRDYLGKRESTRKPYHAHEAARVSPEWLAVQGVGRTGHGLPPEGRAGGARQALGDAGDRIGARESLKGCKRADAEAVVFLSA